MEIKPNKTKKFNQPFWGLIFGILLPAIFFLGVFLYFYFTSDKSDFNFKLFIDFLTERNLFIPIVTACVLPNLLLYIIFKKLDYWYSIKGLVASILLYVILALILKFI